MLPLPKIIAAAVLLAGLSTAAKWAIILGIAGGAAAAGIIVATHGGSTPPGGSSSPGTITITPGTPTVGGPQ